MSVEINRPLKLDGAHNVRELGGYMTADGRRTKERVFLRGDSLDSLSIRDRQQLRRYPVGLVVDLRSGYETRLAPDRLDRHFERAHVPMLDHVQSELARRIAEHDAGRSQEEVPHSLGDIYVLLAETEQAELRQVLKMLIDADKPALFHCAVGKDRTGIISMFLLEMAGVPEATILADYAATARYLREAHGYPTDMDGIPDDAYDSRPEILQKLRNHVRDKYGSVLGYLEHIGITPADVARLREKFTEDVQSA